MDDTVGPNPVYWFPDHLPQSLKMHVAIKSITLLTAEQGLIPESLIILPFPLLKLKGLGVKTDSQKGDHFVRVNLTVPKNLSASAKKTLKELAKKENIDL